MNPSTTFKKWLDASKNNGHDKRWFLLYIQKLNENIDVLPSFINPDYSSGDLKEGKIL